MSSGVSKQTAARVERLLRSLVGVADVRLIWKNATIVRDVHLLRDAHVQHHQLTRNVVSGLRAAFGMELDGSHVHIHDEPHTFEQIATVEPAAATVAAEVPPAAVTIPVNGTANGKHEVPALDSPVLPVLQQNARRVPARNTKRNSKVQAKNVELGDTRSPIVLRPVETELRLPSDPILLDHIDVERHGGGLRCRIVLAVGERKYAAVADALDGPTAEADVAGRVTLDALRAGGLSSATLQGIGLITIADCSYVVATVRDGANGVPRAGSVPLVDSMAWSSALAVLRAVGADAPAELRPINGPLFRHSQLNEKM